MPYLRVTEPDGSEWVSAEAFDVVLTALKNCVDHWPAALNDDLQERTYQEARAAVEILEGTPDGPT